MKYFLLATLALAPSLVAQIPAGYYDSVDTTNAATMRPTLHAVIDDHVRFPYTSGGTDTWDILELADEDPNDAGRILDIYRNASYAKVGGGNPDYQREHTWPSSYGFPNDNPDNYPYSDCFQLYLCDGGYNAARSNKPFKNCNAACMEQPTVLNDGVGGGTGIYPGNSNWTDGFFTFGTWEVWEERKGDIARAQLYMDVRYEGGFHGITGASEPDLILTDDVNLIDSSSTGSNESVGYHGILSVLLQWHIDDPVDAREMSRNEQVFAFQGNRNPFIDHPEWVAILWGGSSSPETPPWINEFHYDNDGADIGEFVEIAGPAGLDLSGWNVLGYNGSNGTVYDTIALGGTIPDQGGCIGTLAFDVSGLQNGAPDGFALADSLGTVHHFISYEGSIVATDGPALGMMSVDVGVSESSATPVGYSIQLSGFGTGFGDFAWQPEQTDTRGLPNTGQTFGDVCGDIMPPLDPTGLVASNGTEIVSLDWNDNVDIDLAGYNVYRSTISGAGFVKINGPVVGVSDYDDSTADADTTYFYVVTAVDGANNESGFSNETSATTPPEVASLLPWINEFHYDNAGADVGEFVEVAGPAGFDLTGWRVVGYNGSGGTEYKTIPLSGVLPNESDCLGALAFAFSGMQNGGADGLALVSPANEVIELLSYEGSFLATAGVAAGMVSSDIGVAESTSTPAGFSLQLGGSGSESADFAWQAEQADTPGAANAGQSLSGGCTPLILPYGCGANPAESLTVLSGLPSLNTSMVLGVDNPLGTLSAGSLPIVALALAPDLNFPCGTLIPGWGMAGGGAAGELLIGITGSNPLEPLLIGPPWTSAGNPSPVNLSIPPSPALLGLSLFAQAAMFDATQAPGAEIRLGGALELVLGN